ncbi:hypothetical protein Taro_034872 [Colocasia esculenta]|uniref:Uncharacterized protein n=1 Tax=Colocasia esculenta TaxID=4460 RepID=A0A843WGU6_COLES|nr:hypothetical protein [Colocasia esculenta]
MGVKTWVEDKTSVDAPDRLTSGETSQQRQGTHRVEETGRYPSGSPDLWAATAKIGSSTWAGGRVLGVVTTTATTAAAATAGSLVKEKRRISISPESCTLQL